MTNEEILSKLGNIKKGCYVSLKKKKDLGQGITKVSNLVVRLGVDFKNMKVNENRTNPVQGLKWGNWVKGLEGIAIEHNNNFYLRVANSYSNNNKSTYLKEGKEISKEDVEALIGAKKLETNPADVYNIKFENILALGKE